MGSYVIRLKVLPPDTETVHAKILESVAKVLPEGVRIRSHKIEPIAFGLSAIIMDVIAPEEDGIIDKVEHIVSTAPLVSQCEFQGVSRMSSKLPPS
jgi:elongation factor 1-beta